MILDIPNHKDFEKVGIDYLNIAWGNCTQALIERIESDYNEEKYLLSLQRQLHASLALIQQAVELILKSKICKVSPFLLISGKPDNWPKNCSLNDISFSEFRTIDSQDLIKVVNTVCEERLTDQFISWFNDLRKLRNKIMHSVDINLSFTDYQVAEIVLEASSFLIGDQEWIKLRNTYLCNSPQEQLDDEIEDYISDAYHLGRLQSEILNVIDNMQPSKVKKYFNFDPKKKRHTCENCLRIRENEYFFKLKNHEHYYLATAYWIKKDLNKAYCLFCHEKAEIEIVNDEESDS